MVLRAAFPISQKRFKSMGGRSSGFVEEAIHIVRHILFHGRVVGRNHRFPHSHRFKEGDANAFIEPRRKVDSGAAQGWSEVGPASSKTHAIVLSIAAGNLCR